MITEVSFYLPDIPGQFARCLKVFANADININGFSVDIGGAFSEVRLICSEPEKAKAELEKHGYEVEEAKVFALTVPNEPGQLLHIAEVMGKNGVNIEYAYCILGSGAEEKAYIIVKVEDKEEAKVKSAAAKKYLESEGIEDLDKLPETSGKL